MAAARNSSDQTIALLHRAIDEAIIFFCFHLPAIKAGTFEALEHIFQTKALTRQLALAIALEAGVVTVNQVVRVARSILSLSSHGSLIRYLEEKQSESKTQDEWMDLAERIDNVRGDDIWRGDPNCHFYEKDRITARVDEFIHLMRRRDVFELMFLLRGGIARNKFGLLHEGLFSKAKGGTKVLVETYHNVVCAALDFVCDAPIEYGIAPIPTEARLAFFNETRHAYGRTALLLSGGGTLGMYHGGVVKALLESRLLPRVIGGASAGSIVCGMLGTRTDEECINDWLAFEGTNVPGHSGKLSFSYLRFPNFPSCNDNDKNAGLVLRTWRAVVPRPLRVVANIIYDVATFKTPLLDVIKADGEMFREAVRTNVGEFTFQEAFDRTGRILNISVTPMNTSDPPRLLNYLTAPHVLIWSAVVASSSLPGVFGVNRLMVKDADGTIRYETTEVASFADGSMEQDLPMEQLQEMFNVNHFIISQANPHAFMLSSYYHSRSVWSNPVIGFFNDVVTFLKNRWRTWLAHFVELVGARRFAPQHATSRFSLAGLFVQDYQGRHCDISLIPWINHQSVWTSLCNFLRNPDIEELKEWTNAAERETWQQMPAIRSHIAEEVTLDRCVQRLRNRFLAESHAKQGNVPSGSMGERVPSFFASPSLVNLGALNVTDGPNIEDVDPVSNSADQPKQQGSNGQKAENGTSPGTSLPVKQNTGDGSNTAQLAGEESKASELDIPTTSKSWDCEDKRPSGNGMARFYYRNFNSSGHHEFINRSSSGDRISDSSTPGLRRQKSLSHPELAFSHV